MSVINVTNENFEAEVASCEKTVLIDFWASWCGPCKMLSPVIDAIALENEDIKVCKVNVDDCPELAQAFGVMSIPTLVVFKDGQQQSKSVGVKSKAAILDMLG